MSLPGADPGALLRIYLDYGRVSEAAILFMEFVKAWTNLVRLDQNLCYICFLLMA